MTEPLTEAEIVGSIVTTPTGQSAVIVVASIMFDLALCEILDERGERTGKRGILQTLKTLQRAVVN